MTPEEAQHHIDAAHGLSPRLDHDLPYIVDGKDIVDMAETIAGLRWEYAVQIDYPTGERLYVRPGICTKYPDRAWWTSKPSEAHAVAVKTREKSAHPVCLVRRLVSQPEEVKP